MSQVLRSASLQGRNPSGEFLKRKSWSILEKAPRRQNSVPDVRSFLGGCPGALGMLAWCIWCFQYWPVFSNKCSPMQVVDPSQRRPFPGENLDGHASPGAAHFRRSWYMRLPHLGSRVCLIRFSRNDPSQISLLLSIIHQFLLIAGHHCSGTPGSFHNRCRGNLLSLWNPLHQLATGLVLICNITVIPSAV